MSIDRKIAEQLVPSGGEHQCPLCRSTDKNARGVDLQSHQTCQHPWHDQPTPATIGPNTIRTPEGLATLGIGSQIDESPKVLNNMAMDQGDYDHIIPSVSAEATKPPMSISEIAGELRNLAKSRNEELIMSDLPALADMLDEHEEVAAPVPQPQDTNGERMKTGVELISDERQRQVSQEGWNDTHDDNYHDSGVLAQAGICYAQTAEAQIRMQVFVVPDRVADKWPWDRRWWKPTADPVRNLVKAGALIAAEIDRLQRAESVVAPSAPQQAKEWLVSMNLPNPVIHYFKEYGQLDRDSGELLSDLLDLFVAASEDTAESVVAPSAPQQEIEIWEFIRKWMAENIPPTQNALYVWNPEIGKLLKDFTAAKEAEISRLTAELKERPTKLAYDCTKSVCDRIATIVKVTDNGFTGGDDLVKAVSELVAVNASLTQQLKTVTEVEP